METYQKIGIVSAFILGSYLCCSSSDNPNNVEAKDQKIQQAINPLENIIKKGPKDANFVLRRYISTMKKEEVPYDTETKITLFREIRDSFEDTPELTDMLGPRSKEYMRKRLSSKSPEESRSNIQSLYDSLGSAGKTLGILKDKEGGQK